MFPEQNFTIFWIVIDQEKKIRNKFYHLRRMSHDVKMMLLRMMMMIGMILTSILFLVNTNTHSPPPYQSTDRQIYRTTTKKNKKKKKLEKKTKTECKHMHTSSTTAFHPASKPEKKVGHGRPSNPKNKNQKKTRQYCI